MAAHSPEELHTLYAARVASGDLDGLVELYEDVAAFNGGPDGLLRGPAAIREHLGAVLARQPAFDLRTRSVVTAGDIALLACDWRLAAKADDGTQVERSGISVEVARRQEDGTWRYIIDEPSFLG